MTVHPPVLRRVGLVVPSSNTTMETEVPALPRRQALLGGTRFTCHSARLRLRELRAETLRAMNEGAGEAAESLCEAGVDALVHACPVAAMVDGRASMTATRERLLAATAGARHGRPALVTSADALVAALGRAGLGLMLTRPAAQGELGSYPIFGFERDRVRVHRDGPGLAAFKNRIPERLRSW
jgi:maleate cis-trans isomerase